MTIVKINLYKLHAERNLEAKGGQISINNNVSIKDIEEMSFQIDGKNGLVFTFAFNCNYEPGLGKIEVEGQVLFIETEAKINEVKQSWKKDKKIPLDVMEQIVNAALHKGNIQAIKISEEVNLPSPLPLPKVRTSPAPTSAKPAEKGNTGVEKGNSGIKK
jgi:hypothetical protein